MAGRERELRFDQKMSDAEALMWNVEKDPWLNPNGAMVTILDRPPDFAVFSERIKHAVAKVARLRERVVPGFGRLSPPTWATDAEFDFDYHVRHVSLPAPGTERQLFDLATRLYEDPFDRTRPLWIFYVIEGLSGGRGALFSKLHHSITDGIGAIRLSELYVEGEREAPAPEPIDLDALIAEAAAAESEEEQPDGTPSPLESMLKSTGHVARRQAGIARRALGELATWSADPMQARDVAEDFASSVKAAVEQVPRSDGEGGIEGGSPLWKRRSRKRHLEAVSVPLDDLKSAGKALDASINDMFVAGAVLGALRYHAKRSTPVEALNISFVVSTRTDAAIGGNNFTPTPVQIPGDIDDPEAVLADVRDRMEQRREAVSGGGGGLAGLAGVANLLPTSVVTQVARTQAAKMDFATSNLRGAPFATYMSGGKVLQNVIMGPVAGTAMNVTTLSYNGNLDIGLFMDGLAIEDPADLRDCIAAGYEELLDAGGVVTEVHVSGVQR